MSTFCYFVFNRTPREIELDNDFDKLTAVLTRMLHQVKVWVGVWVGGGCGCGCVGVDVDVWVWVVVE